MHHAERGAVAVVYLRHCGAQLGEDEALPGEYQGTPATTWSETSVRQQAKKLEAEVSWKNICFNFLSFQNYSSLKEPRKRYSVGISSRRVRF